MYLPERDERDQAEPRDAAERDHAEQETHGAWLIRSFARQSRAACGCEPAQVRRQRERDGGDAKTRQGEQKPATQSVLVDEEGRDDRAEGKADVPADREPRHPARPLPPAHIARELRAFRMERGDSDARDEDEDDDEPVLRRVRRERDPDACERDPSR